MIGEEHGAARDNHDQTQRLWAIDPIDGTNPYLNGLPSWGVCIGVSWMAAKFSPGASTCPS